MSPTICNLSTRSHRGDRHSKTRTDIGSRLLASASHVTLPERKVQVGDRRATLKGGFLLLSRNEFAEGSVSIVSLVSQY